MKRFILLALTSAALSGCVASELNDNDTAKTVDGQQVGRSDLSELRAGIWVDPAGCEHWIIDDGIEGYLSQRLQRNGRPVCGSTAPPTYATGPFRGGQDINDSI